MSTGLYAAVSGSLAHEKRLAILTNNLANANTVGFKADKPVFQVDPLPSVGGPLPASEGAPAEITSLDRFQGRASAQTRLGSVHTDFTQGDLRQTGNTLDVALEGRGFFAVQTADGVAYTRQGTFSLNAEGVMVTAQGLPVLGDKGPLRLPQGKIEIAPSGQVSVNGTLVDRLKVVDFPQPSSLEKQGDTLFRSLDPTPPETTTNAVVRQGALETANVEPVRLMISVMETSRAYEAYQKVIQAFNDIAGRAVNDIAGRTQ
jgi:flagellar basal-body rod protein FlgF